jgi:hypothetical protein
MYSWLLQPRIENELAGKGPCPAPGNVEDGRFIRALHLDFGKRADHAKNVTAKQRPKRPEFAGFFASLGTTHGASVTLPLQRKRRRPDSLRRGDAAS